MKVKKNDVKCLVALVALAFVSIGAQTAFGQTLLDHYQAQAAYYNGGVNYNPVVWIDSGPGADNASPAQSTSYPQLLPDTTPNGSPALNWEFDPYPTHDTVQQVEVMDLATPLTALEFTSTPDFTISAVAAINWGASGSPILGGSAAGDLDFVATDTGSGGLTISLEPQSSASISGDISIPGYAPGTYAIFTATYGSGDWALYYNGFEVGSGTSSTTFSSPATTTIGGSAAAVYDGDIADLEIYNGTLTAEQVGDNTSSGLLYTQYQLVDLENSGPSFTVPEPASWALMGVGLLAMLCLRRKLANS